MLVIVGEGFHNLFLGIIKTLQVKKYWHGLILCSYVIGLGSAILLVEEFKLGLTGIWVGWLIGISICLVVELRFLSKINWEEHFDYVREKYKIIAHEARISKREVSSYGDLAEN